MKIYSRFAKIFSILLCSIVFFACGDSSSNIKYVAIGASDAFGIGAVPLTNGYVYQIDDKLAASTGGVDLINLGLPGAETDEFIDIELPLAKKANPDLITIWAGPNDLIDGDSVETFDSRLETLLSELVQDTHAFIAIATLPDLTKLPTFISDPDPDVTLARIAGYNSVIISMAAEFGVSVVDLSKFEVTASLISDLDGFHPSNEGHALLADLFLEVIEPVFTNQ